MNDNAKAWVAALRSGDYKQSKRFLTRIDENGDIVGHCCLGVACVLAVEASIIPKPTRDGGCLEYDGYTFMLPGTVQEWLGLSTSEGYFGTASEGILTSLNDNEGKTFDEIADVIESEPEGLFKSE